MSTLPFVPDNAPFTPEQRAWLNGFLAGMFSEASAAPKPASTADTLQFAIYFATQSGTAENLAKKLAKRLKGEGHTASVRSLSEVSPSQIAKERNALFLVSTYGDGEAPESAKAFQDALFASHAPDMSAVRYAVFALGDRNYEQFCAFGLQLDQRLAALGAHRASVCVEADVDVAEPFAGWATEIGTSFAKNTSVHLAKKHEVLSFPRATGRVFQSQTATREAPCSAPVLERLPLTAGGSSKQTLHVVLGADEAHISYQAGDACGVIPQNDPALVAEILEHLPFSAVDTVRLPKQTCSVQQALSHHLQITRATRKMAEGFATRSESAVLRALLHADQAQQLDAYLHGRGLLDLLMEFPGTLHTAQDLAEFLPRLTPRLYSISSSPTAHKGELHLTVGVVRYHAHGRDRGGVASTMIADRIAEAAALPIYIQPNKRFRIPADGMRPIILIGPGTGIAPFRAFLHERRALGHAGPNWLFFGERSAATDFLYRDELAEMRDSGHLTRFDTAFSRDQERKVYVQDRMREHGAEMWRWLQDGAQVYVCGDAARMAKGVDTALHEIVRRHGAMSEEKASEYVSQLAESERYHRDVY